MEERTLRELLPAQTQEHATIDLRVLSSKSTLGIEMT